MQYKLIQKDRWVYIRPAPDQHLRSLIERELTYIKNGAKFYPNPEWAKVKLYQQGYARFPIGLTNRVSKILERNGFPHEKKLRNIAPCDLKEDFNGLYDFQQSALRMALLRSGGILQMPTGAGKTRTAISIINTLKMPTLVIVPTIDLVNQWKTQVSKNVHVRTYQGLKSKAYIQQFKLVIFDECHNVAAKTLQKIGMNLREEALTVGLSATPFMRDDDNLKVESIIGPVIYKISLRELIDENYLVDAEIHYHPLEKFESSIHDYQMMYEDYIVRNEERNEKIVDLAVESKGHTLVLINRIDHGEYLYDKMKNRDADVVFLHGKSKNRDDTNHKIIIATSIFDEGIDIPHLKNLILGGGGKSSIKTTQRIGRVLRKYPNKEKAIVHDFMDDCKWLRQHYKQRREIYEQDFETENDAE